MRITARIAGAGENGLTRLPFLDITSIDDDLCTGGRLDESKCRRVLNHPDDGVQISSNDSLPVFAFAVELVKQVGGACHRMIANRRNDAGNRDAHDVAECADDRHAARNLHKGRVVFVRTDISYSRETGTLKLKVDIQNPRNVVGVAERIALDYALILARVANNIADQLSASEGAKWNFRFFGGEGCPTLFEDARRIDKELADRAMVKRCERRMNGYCSPIKPECPFYADGKCAYSEK